MGVSGIKSIHTLSLQIASGIEDSFKIKVDAVGMCGCQIYILQFHLCCCLPLEGAGITQSVQWVVKGFTAMNHVL